MILSSFHPYLFYAVLILAIISWDCLKEKAWISSILSMILLVGIFFAKIPTPVYDENLKETVIDISIIDFFKNQSVKKIDGHIKTIEEKTEECSIGYWVIPGKFRGYKKGVSLNKYTEYVSTHQGVLYWDNSSYFLTKPKETSRIDVESGSCIEESLTKENKNGSRN